MKDRSSLTDNDKFAIADHILYCRNVWPATLDDWVILINSSSLTLESGELTTAKLGRMLRTDSWKSTYRGGLEGCIKRRRKKSKQRTLAEAWAEIERLTREMDKLKAELGVAEEPSENAPSFPFLG